MKNYTPEIIEKAKAARSAEELLSLAKENNVEMTEEEAKTYFAQLSPKSGELNDDELDAVAGGACGNYEPPKVPCPYCQAINPLGSATDEYGKVTACVGCGKSYIVYYRDV